MTIEHRVLTALGADRPGLVNMLATVIRESGGNIQDSRMAILGGEFAVILLLSAPGEAVATIEKRTSEIGEQLGLTVVVKPTTAAGERRDYLTYRLRVSGLDHPGIVETVTRILSERQVNVASLDTRLVYAPLSGTPIFSLDGVLQVPPGVSVKELRQALTDACEQEQVDCTLDAHV